MSIVISWSEIDAYRQCPFKHQLAYVERWSKPHFEGPLARGSWWHRVLEAHYSAIQRAGLNKRSGRDWADAAVDLVFSDMRMVDAPDLDLIQWMYAGYLDLYGYDPGWGILAVEHTAEIPLNTDFTMKVKMDLVVRDQAGLIWLIDHKSGANLPSKRDLDFDDQFGLYVWALRKMGRKVHGVIYGAARTKRNKVKEQPLEERFSRTLMVRTDTELDTIARETLQTAYSMYDVARGHISRGQIDAERHPDTDRCKWRCDFTEACLLGRKTDNYRTRLFLQETGFERDHTRH